MRSGLKCLRIIHSRIGRAKEKLKQLFGPASDQCRPKFVVISAPAETLLAEEIWQASLIDHVQHWLRTVDDPWLHVRGEAVLGELARIQHRFDDAVAHLGRAAETSRRLGFLQREAYQLSGTHGQEQRLPMPSA